MVKWIVIAVVVLGLVLLGIAGMSVVRRLPELDRAMRKLMRRQEEALKLQADAEQLQRTILAVQHKAEIAQEQVAVIKAGRGDNGKHSLQSAPSAW
jgi:hypothetical protein